MSEIALPYRPRSEEDPRAASVVQSNLDYLTGLFTKGNNNGDTLQWDVIAQKFVATNLPAPPTLPARLGATAYYPLPGNDWNNALDNGWYMQSSGANAPHAGWLIGMVVQHNSSWVMQEVVDFTAGQNGVRYKRWKLGGTWTGWVPLTPMWGRHDAQVVIGAGVWQDLGGLYVYIPTTARYFVEFGGTGECNGNDYYMCPYGAGLPVGDLALAIKWRGIPPGGGGTADTRSRKIMVDLTGGQNLGFAHYNAANNAWWTYRWACVTALH